MARGARIETQSTPWKVARGDVGDGAHTRSPGIVLGPRRGRKEAQGREGNGGDTPEGRHAPRIRDIPPVPVVLGPIRAGMETGAISV